MGQWLRIHIPNAGDSSSIPGQGIKIPRAMQRCRKILKEEEEKGKERKVFQPGDSGRCQSLKYVQHTHTYTHIHTHTHTHTLLRDAWDPDLVFSPPTRQEISPGINPVRSLGVRCPIEVSLTMAEMSCTHALKCGCHWPRGAVEHLKVVISRN